MKGRVSLVVVLAEFGMLRALRIRHGELGNVIRRHHARTQALRHPPYTQQ
jgi:hypothetical protein